MPFAEIDSAQLPGGDQLTLRRNGEDFEIRVGLYELMSSKNPVSERAMAALAVVRVPGVQRVLIGGLGMGYTVRAMLDACEARITVAELVPAVVAWNRGPLAALAGRPLEDPRVDVFAGDVVEALRANPGAFDVILMDVDNGPEAVMFDRNRPLYTAEGLNLLQSGLAPGGVLAVWAADPSPHFAAIAGQTCERVDVAVTASVTHTLYFVRPAPAKMPEALRTSGACKPARRPL